MQGILFVLGGLLLGTAAVVFTAVALTSVGITGRALILAAVTAVVLALPPLAARRGLRGTAESLAAVGMLLVLLDGYAVWAVDLGGATGWPGTRYTGLVALAAALVAAGYARLSRLTGPWFWALLLIQPVPPLLATEARPSATGWSLVFLGVTLVDLALLRVLLRTAPAPVPASAPTATGGGNGPRIVGQVLAGIQAGLALVVATGFALVPFGWGEAFGVTALAGLPLLLVVGVIFVTALVTGARVLAVTGGGVLVPVLAVALLRPVAAEWPRLSLLATAVIAVGLAGAVRLLPHRLRPGPRIGALVVTGGVALAFVAFTLAGAVATQNRSLPAWRGAEPGPDLPWGWQLPVGLLLLAGAAVLLVPRFLWWSTGVAAGTLAVFALPAAWPAPWPAVVALDLVGGVGLLVAAVAVRGARLRRVLPPAVGGLLLVVHALQVGLAAPAGLAVVLAVTALTGLVVATLGRRGSTGQRVIAGLGLAVALPAAPAGVPLALVALEVPAWWQARALLLAVALLLGVRYLLRRDWPELHWYADGGYAAAVGLAVLVGAVTPAREPVALYAALGVLLLAGPARWGLIPRVSGFVLAGAAVLTALPVTLEALFAPYRPVPGFWTGVPTEPAPGSPAIGAALLVLAVAVLLLGWDGADPAVPQVETGRVSGWERYGRALFALPFLVAALPVLLVAIEAPWPVVPAVLLSAGTAALLLVGLLRPYPLLVGTALPSGLVAVGAGLLGLLATRESTLAGTGALLLASVTLGVAARHELVRALGWLTGVLATLGFALTAAAAAGLTLSVTAFGVLGVAVVTLAGAGALLHRQPVSARVLEVLAPVVALLAFLLSLGTLRYAAVVCVLWGLAVGLRVVLPPGGSTGRRYSFAALAAGSELLGLWLLLAAGRVVLLEAYTVPAAVLAVAVGLVALHGRPGLTSWLALGPGLAAALLPSLVSVLVAGEDQPWRRLLVGLAALVVLLVGALRRWQAPVVLGSGVLVVTALHELSRGWDLLPRWIYLGLGGIVLLSLAATFERRRRDLTRLRDAVGRMR